MLLGHLLCGVLFGALVCVACVLLVALGRGRVPGRGREHRAWSQRDSSRALIGG